MIDPLDALLELRLHAKRVERGVRRGDVNENSRRLRASWCALSGARSALMNKCIGNNPPEI
jgi:hypothetical protein